MTFAGSRYEGVPLQRDDDGNLYIGRIIPPSRTVEYREYYTSESDRMDTLAARFLDDPTRWWEIADLNPEVETFEELPPNTRLRIPRVRSRAT